jgi:hypothetical protein
MVRNPTAGIVIYNYKERGGSVDISSQQTEKIYITKSIMSIGTAKNKSSPSGKFEITLAPTKNWISEISIGSWIEIHMSPKVLTQSDLEASSIETLKLIGMIDSVRMSVSVDQSTGARITTYSIVGRDWGAALESYVYVDSAITDRNDSPLEAALRLGFAKLFLSLKEQAWAGKFSSSNLVMKIISYWGISSISNSKNQKEVAQRILPQTNTGQQKPSPEVGSFDKFLNQSNKSAISKSVNISRYAPISEFLLPIELSNKIDAKMNSLAKSIKLIDGRLIKYNMYSGDEMESVGLIDPQRIIGTNTLWQLLNVHCNDVVNELVADLRWPNEKAYPEFALYKRIKPFWLPNQATKTPGGDPKIKSSFFNVRKVNISKQHVLSIETGDNAEDIINFIEIVPQVPAGYDVDIAVLATAKNKSATHDPASFARYGIKPMFYSTLFFPASSKGGPEMSALDRWLPVLRGWFFDCHKMLNGTVTIIGQNNYIGVGDNILMDSEIFGDLNYVKEEVGKKPSDIKILAHVQSVSHRFSYIENGSRSFVTTISFVRGIMTDAKGENLIGSKSFGIATESSDVKDKSRSNVSYKDEATK